MWQVYGVSDDAIDRVKELAAERGLKIGEYLSWHFVGEVERVYNKPRIDRTKTFRLTIKESAYEKLKAKAKAEGYGLSRWLEKLAED